MLLACESIMIWSCSTPCKDTRANTFPQLEQSERPKPRSPESGRFQKRIRSSQIAGEVRPTLSSEPSDGSTWIAVGIIAGLCILGLIIGTLSGAFVGGARWAVGSGALLAIAGAVGGGYLVEKIRPWVSTPSESASDCNTQGSNGSRHHEEKFSKAFRWKQ